MKIFSKNFFKSLLLLFGSVVFVFVLFELYLRLFNPQIFDVHPQWMYITDKETGYALNPGFKGVIERSEFETHISINEEGLRGNSFNKEDKNVYRILVLGDSQTFGFGVKEDETFSAYLEKCLNESNSEKYEVLNGGVPGYGTIDQLNFLKTRGYEIKPNLVILQFLSDNDIYENKYPANEWANIRDGWFGSRDSSYKPFNLLPFWRKVEFWLKDNFHSVKFLSERIGYILLKSGLLGNTEKAIWGEDFSKEDGELLESVIIEMNNYIKKLHSEFLVLFTTGQGQVLTENDPNLNSEILIRKILTEQKIKWINIFRMMRESDEKNNFYYSVDGHWKSAGHKFIAEVLCKRVLNNLSK